jgi:capsular polysaccharide biosynthesis protein
MKINELLAPIFRRKKLFWSGFLLFLIIFLGLFKLIPDVQKTTIYFTVKTPKTEFTSIADPAETASKIAETIAGWAKNPSFRAEILDTAISDIPNFKRKISARRQNRMNVFWTLKFYKNDLPSSSKIVSATIDVLKKNIEEISQENAFPISISEPSTFSEFQTIPFLWKILAAIFAGFFTSILLIFITETFGGKITFIDEIKEIFDIDTPILKINTKNNDEYLLEKYIQTFKNPRLISLASNLEKYLSFSEPDEVNLEFETPILCIKLGQTKIRDLENMQAMFGNNVSVIVFED